MKKILLLLTLFIFSASFVNANNSKIINHNLNLYKKKIEQENKTDYAKKIEKNLAKMNQETLEKLAFTLTNFLKTYKWEYFNFLKYIKFKIDETLFDLQNFEVYKNEKLGFEILKDSRFLVENKDNEKSTDFFRDKDSFWALPTFFVWVMGKDFLHGNNLENFLKTGEQFKDFKIEEVKINWRKFYKLDTWKQELYLTEEYDSVYSITFEQKNYKDKEKVLNSLKIIWAPKEKYSLEKVNQESRDLFREATLRSFKNSLSLYNALNNNYKLPDSLEKLEFYRKDPKDWEIIDGCRFGYNYEKISDTKARISYCVESDEWKEKAKNDNGIYLDKYEYIVDINE